MNNIYTHEDWMEYIIKCIKLGYSDRSHWRICNINDIDSDRYGSNEGTFWG